MRIDMSEKKILNCPFCGGCAELVKRLMLVTCTECSATVAAMHGDWAKRAPIATKAWNTRTTIRKQ